MFITLTEKTDNLQNDLKPKRSVKMKTLKQLNNEIYASYLQKTQTSLDYNTLNDLYTIHSIMYNLLAFDKKIRERILKAIRKEQRKLEDKKVEE
jgi:hypothetical protein